MSKPLTLKDRYIVQGWCTVGGLLILMFLIWGGISQGAMIQLVVGWTIGSIVGPPLAHHMLDKPYEDRDDEQ